MLPTLFALVLNTIALPPKPAHYLTDNAGVISADRAAALDRKLAGFERDTSNQIYVYVDHRVPQGSTAEQIGTQALQSWSGASDPKSNTAVVLVFVDDGQVRIKASDGLGSTLTDARSKLITSAIMKPRMQTGDYAGAVEHGVDAILNSVGSESYQSGSGRGVAAASAAAPGGVSLAVIIAAFGAGVAVLAAVMAIRAAYRAQTEKQPNRE